MPNRNNNRMGRIDEEYRKETVWPCLYGNPPYDLPDQRRRNCRTDYHPERSENQRTCRTDFESINPSIRRIRYGKERRT